MSIIGPIVAPTDPPALPWERRGGAVPWTPALDAGARVWLRADLGITLSSSKVTTWASQVGDAVLTQGTDANRPTITASDANFGGQAVLTGAGSQWLRDTSFTSVSQRYLCLVVARATSGVTQILCDDGGGAADSPAIYYASGSWRASAPTVINSADTTLTGTRAHAFDANGLSSAYYIDDFTTPKVSGVSAGTNAANSLTVMASSAGAGGLNGALAELIITTSTDLAPYRTYFNSRYGLSIV